MVGATEEVTDSTGQGSVGRRDKQNRRKRLRLSCDECRKKKLSCDRELPCQRCVRSGRPELCSFETGTGKPFQLSNHLAQEQAQRNSDEIHDLRAEVFQLKEMLSKAQRRSESNSVQPNTRAERNPEPGTVTMPLEVVEEDRSLVTDSIELSDPRQRSPHGYYNQHTLLRFFMEIPQLFPLIKETSAEWLQPLGIHLKKSKSARNDWTTTTTSPEGRPMENLLPPKADTDSLIHFYLSHFEQVHRIVHVPTFKKAYAHFWSPEERRDSGTTALVLSMISISACTISGSSCSTLIPTMYRATAVQWIAASDEWLKQQSSKHGKLLQYQVSCLLYLAKRVNIVRKKRFWKESGGLVQNAIMDGLYHDKSSTVETPYMREMKRRIWVVVRELDLQNALEYGFPSLLYNITSATTPPANVNDNEFNEKSKELPSSRSPMHYTSASYQYLSSLTWNLRLEIARRLSNTELSKQSAYDDVLRYTHEVTKAIHSLPSWDKNEHGSEHDGGLSILTYAYLYFQLGGCILALHRPHLQRDKGEFSISGNICYNVARDILLLNTRLAAMGLQSVTGLRDDLLGAALCITHITMQQPPGSTSIIMTYSESMIEILLQCLPLIEERYLRCFYGEPWCVLTMSASLMLLKIQVGKETWQSAKVACAQRFLDLYYKNIGRQQTSLLSQQQSEPRDALSNLDTVDPSQPLIRLTTPVNSALNWLDNSCTDIGTDFFDFDIDFDESWENWE